MIQLKKNGNNNKIELIIFMLCQKNLTELPPKLSETEVNTSRPGVVIAEKVNTSRKCNNSRRSNRRI